MPPSTGTGGYGLKASNGTLTNTYDMGNLIIKGIEFCKARKLDSNDPVIKQLIADTIEAQKKMLALKKYDAESMRKVINL